MLHKRTSFGVRTGQVTVAGESQDPFRLPGPASFSPNLATSNDKLIWSGLGIRQGCFPPNTSFGKSRRIT